MTLSTPSRNGKPIFGIALYPRDGVTGEDLIRSADTALFEAKKERSSFRFFTREMQDKAFEKLSMVSNLHRAINESQFEPHFQPVLDMQERALGCECLLRWDHPKQGAIPPGYFIPIAEETGLINALGRIGIRDACMLLNRLKELGITSSKVAVNLSVKQIRDKKIVMNIESRIREFDIDPRCLEFEITESGFMAEPAVLSRIEDLRKSGIRFPG